jgi:hypothetical protein
MPKAYEVIGDSPVAGKLKGESIDAKTLDAWPANVEALIAGGHITDPAGSNTAPVDPAPDVPVETQEG